MLDILGNSPDFLGRKPLFRDLFVEDFTLTSRQSLLLYDAVDCLDVRLLRHPGEILHAWVLRQKRCQERMARELEKVSGTAIQTNLSVPDTFSDIGYSTEPVIPQCFVESQVPFVPDTSTDSPSPIGPALHSSEEGGSAGVAGGLPSFAAIVEIPTPPPAPPAQTITYVKSWNA